MNSYTSYLLVFSIFLFSNCQRKIEIAQYTFDSVEVKVFDTTLSSKGAAYIEIKETNEKAVTYFVDCMGHNQSFIEKEGEFWSYEQQLNDSTFLHSLLPEVTIKENKIQKITPIEKRAFEVATPDIQQILHCEKIDLSKIIGFVGYDY